MYIYDNVLSVGVRVVVFFGLCKFVGVVVEILYKFESDIENFNKLKVIELVLDDIFIIEEVLLKMV